MPVQLSKDVGSSGSQVSLPAQILSDTPGYSSRTVSSSPSIESLSSGRDHAMSSPPLPASRGRDSSTSSPPLSATKKDSFFNISRSRSHSKTMGKRDTVSQPQLCVGKRDTEELENQVSLLQGQINDLEAMSKYCAKMMNVHIGKIQEVILQEHLQKEDEVLVSLAGLKQIKDILKGALRFNQSQLEAEENEEITIADDHYCSTGAHAHTHTHTHTHPHAPRQKPMEQELETRQLTNAERGTPPTIPQQQAPESRNWDDYILVSQDGEGDGDADREGEGELPPAEAQPTPVKPPSTTP
ncbi:hypothetical protein AALO_G00261820 [Alosa alosa]|uniref:TBC1 domain family member 5 n=1 Tax=Alosa alosa TaxID=278164 RepID=A0AAV6FQK7_9TELE|nr:hypothetical protein AALO_G00261820 [Alosa alosa]